MNTDGNDNGFKFYFLFFFMILHCINSEQWTDNQGKMNWDEAKKRCESFDKRLPTRAELIQWNKIRKIIQFGEIQKPAFYWTSEENSKSDAYIFDLQSGNGHYYKKTAILNTLCIK